jgi:hypothetical protein
MKIMIICFLTFLKNLLTSNLTALANTAKESIGLIGLANRFEAGQDAFVQISPLGDFPHAKGLQRMDRAAAEGMVNHFNKFSSKLGRMFVGVPFYVGHPDLPGLENEYPDRKAYGWVKAWRFATTAFTEKWTGANQARSCWQIRTTNFYLRTGTANPSVWRKAGKCIGRCS